MYPRRSLLPPTRFLFDSLTVLILVGSSFATTEKLVYSFAGQADGVNPNAALVADAAGNLYAADAELNRVTRWAPGAATGETVLSLPRGSGPGEASGIVGIAAGLVILAKWPVSGLWVLGLLVGIDLLLHGVWWISLGGRLRRERSPVPD